MTKINKLVMKGFKSFQKKTVLPFFDGLTAVVGENGAGKSNLFDAITFVMGRRSSQLRADRLEQLIFNGGDKRGPSDSAEVILHLDNSDNVFDPFLENGEAPLEVRLSRRITHSSSTYYFMGKACPRKMIDDILEAAKIDPDGQQLIAQGSVTDVIKRSPIKRREIIDEICGISAYDKRREKAIAELKQVKSRLNTHRVVLAERRRRLFSLEKERADALQFQRLTAEQGRLEESIHHQKRNIAMEKLGRAQEKRSEIAESVSQLESTVKNLDLEVENTEWAIEGMEEKMGGEAEISLVKEVEQIRSQITNRQGEINFKRQQVRNLEEMIKEVARIKAEEAARGRTGTKRNRAVEALLKRKRGGVYGTVEALGRPHSGYEVAFDVAAGGHINDLIVDSRETAIECINYLKQNRLGRARLLPLRQLLTPRKSLASADAVKLPGVIGYAINLVDFDAKYKRAFEYVLYDTIIAESLEALGNIEGVRAVTVDGDLQSKGGAITGGWRPGKRQEVADTKKEGGFDTAEKHRKISKLNKEIRQLEDEVHKLGAKLETKEAELAKKKEETSLIKGQATGKNEQLHTAREKRRQAYRELENLRRSLSRYEREEAQAKTELESLGKEGHDPSYYIEGTLSVLGQRIEKNRKQLRLLEPVNMRAIDEYEQYKKDFDLFRDRVHALEREKREIELLIGQIEERKREHFLNTLQAITVQFNRIFSELFQGGSAALELKEPADISSGLLIKANLPDKGPHLLDSLSGGEKSLVAIAFILALQDYQKAPFFILDEIDAALDVLNASRLSNILQTYAKRIQVIIVSHNEETIRQADRAYGVTMSDGVSQILALNLN